jgi:hypothetical protein
MSGRPSEGPKDDRDLKRVAKVLVNIGLRLTQAREEEEGRE